MDDRRFDQLVKAVASGASRRSVLKGMLGLGGAALVGSAALEPDVDAARRPTPTPTPIRCPGKQTPVNGVCTCPGSALNKCGPDCCTGKVTDAYPRLPNHSECCDNACCFGTCYGEELCCPTNPSGSEGQQAPLAEFCLATNECCLAPDFCCAIDGCCSTVCWGGNLDDDFCCPAENLCPGGGTSPDECCTDGTTCCGAGTDENSCINLTFDDACCTESDCGPPAEGTCGWDCSDNQCVSTVCLEGSVCCDGECVSGSEYEECPADSNQCCDRETDVCCGGACCARGRCNAAQQCCGPTQYLCGVNCCDMTPGGECCGGNTCCQEGKCAGGVTCCTGDDVACGAECCSEDRCGVNAETGEPACCDVGYLACSGNICCRADVYQCATDGPGCECLPGTEPCSALPGGCCPDGQCNDEFFCCPGGTAPCGDDCCDNATQTCSAQGCVCAGGAILCGGVCSQAQCCAGESPDRCVAVFGYDLECVSCPSGFCETSPLNGTLCETDDSEEEGSCVDGFCIRCGGPNAPCDFDHDCCSGVCLEEGVCTDQ